MNYSMQHLCKNLLLFGGGVVQMTEPNYIQFTLANYSLAIA